MANKSKQKGNRFERDIVKLCESFKISCRRAWGSDGRSMGFTEGVDGILNDEDKWQAKCKKTISPFYIPNEEVDMQIFKGDRTPTYVTLNFNDFLVEYVLRINNLIAERDALQDENKKVKDKLYKLI